MRPRRRRVTCAAWRLQLRGLLAAQEGSLHLCSCPKQKYIIKQVNKSQRKRKKAEPTRLRVGNTVGHFPNVSFTLPLFVVRVLKRGANEKKQPARSLWGELGAGPSSVLHPTLARVCPPWPQDFPLWMLKLIIAGTLGNSPGGVGGVGSRPLEKAG